MFDELVRQARRLFSSKSNAGKQVPQLTDRLHTQKQVLLALSIVLLLGYAQFRDHFHCQAIEGIDSKTVTNFCLINGTTTVVHKHPPNAANHDGQGPAHAPEANQDGGGGSNYGNLPHVGHHFVTDAREFRVINHNYMRSLWALLILLAMCSFFAQRNWASLFQNDDVLQALLQLAGSNESPLVRAAEQARPYEMLSALSSNLSQELEMRTNRDPKFKLLPRNERVARKIDLVDCYNNIYDHQLDYYPNQLTYLLLTKNAAAYKLSCMKLRSKLILNTVYSTFFTLLQFLLPLLFIGNEYAWYGWNYLRATLHYLVRLMGPKGSHGAPHARTGPVDDERPDSWAAYDTTNSIDYELSSSIFPTSTQCEFKQFGMTGATESTTVQCTVAINEICSKLFVVIWWFVVLNLLVELHAFLSITLCSLNFRTLSWTFGWLYWPNALAEADVIARFRFSRALLLNRARLLAELEGRAADNTRAPLSPPPPPSALAPGRSGGHPNGDSSGSFHSARFAVSPAERKRLEATMTTPRNKDAKRQWSRLSCNTASQRNKGLGCSWCPRRFCAKLVERGCRLACCQTQRRQRRLELEPAKDLNIYYLLYLIYLRTGKSKSRIESIVRMTARALENYLEDLEESLAIDQPTSMAAVEHARDQASAQQPDHQDPDQHHQHLDAGLQLDEIERVKRSLADEQLKFMS